MIRLRPPVDRPLRRARFALAAFLAALCVTLLAPFVQPVAYELVCSAQGSKIVAHDAGDAGGHDDAAAHAAHCPLCMPAGAPPAVVAWDITPLRPLGRVRSSFSAARLAGLVGAPLPARGPPLLS